MQWCMKPTWSGPSLFHDEAAFLMSLNCIRHALPQGLCTGWSFPSRSAWFTASPPLGYHANVTSSVRPSLIRSDPILSFTFFKALITFPAPKCLFCSRCLAHSRCSIFVEWMNDIFTLSLHTGLTYYFIKCQLPDISEVPPFNSSKTYSLRFLIITKLVFDGFSFHQSVYSSFPMEKKTLLPLSVLSTSKPLRQPASPDISLIHEHFQWQILFSVIHRHTYNCFRKQTRNSEVVLQNYSSLLYILKKICISLKNIYMGEARSNHAKPHEGHAKLSVY